MIEERGENGGLLCDERHLIDVFSLAEVEAIHASYLYAVTRHVTGLEADAERIESAKHDSLGDVFITSFAMVDLSSAAMYQRSVQYKLEGLCELVNHVPDHRVLTNVEHAIINTSRQILENQDAINAAKSNESDHVFIEIFQGFDMSEVLLRQEKELEIVNAEFGNVVLLDMHLGARLEKGKNPKEKVGGHLHNLAVRTSVTKLKDGILGKSPTLRKLFMGRSIQ